jgi:hypothetical protein
MFDLGKRTLGRMGASYNWVPFLALAMMFWSKSGYDSAKARQATPLSPGQLDYLALSDTLNTLAQPADLAVVRKPEITRNLAHVRCITFPYTKDSLEMMQFFAKHKPQFILIDNDAGFTQSAKFLVPFLNAHRQLWSVLVQKQQGNSSSYLLKYNAEKGQALWESWQAAPDADTP